MFPDSIDVMVPHSLGIEGAKARLKALVDDTGAANPHIVPGDFAWNELTHTFTVAAVVYGEPATLTVKIDERWVHVTSDKHDGWLARLGIVYAQGQIHAKLKEVLK